MLQLMGANIQFPHWKDGLGKKKFTSIGEQWMIVSEKGLYQCIKEFLQFHIGFEQYFAGFASLVGAYHTGGLQLVHEPAGPVIAQFHAALYERSRSYLVLHNQPRCIFEQRVAVVDIKVFSFQVFFINIFW